jgi:AcrR family transcriptional regulator
MVTSLRDRRRVELRREIADAALELAQEHGWAQVTVSQVAERVGISRRAFFTHFATKDDAIVHGSSDDLEFLQRALADREEGVTFTEVLRANVDTWLDELGALGTTRRRRQRVEQEHPEIAAKIATARVTALREVALPAVAEDLGVGVEDPVAQLVAGAFSGMGSALDTIFATDRGPAREQVLVSVRLLESLMERSAEELGRRP